MQNQTIHITLANPRGFCAGVDRAIEIVERALELFGAPIYVKHEIVHNRYVVDDLIAKGVIFIEDLTHVPENNILIFSAHGVSKTIQQEALKRNLRIFDATCPLVSKVHMEVSHHSREGKEVILIGHAGHPEVEGTMGQYDNSYGGAMYLVENCQDVADLKIHNPTQLAYVSQTTLSVDDTQEIIHCLRQRFPNIKGPKLDDICYATQNRQDAVKSLTEQCDLILVVGSKNSSNSNRLREIATKSNVEAYLIDEPSQIQENWLIDKQHIGITAGASAPEILVQKLIHTLKEMKQDIPIIELKGIEENMIFALPKDLR